MLTQNLATFLTLFYVQVFLIWQFFWHSTFLFVHLYRFLKKTVFSQFIIYSTLFLDGLLIHQPLVCTVAKLPCQNIHRVFFSQESRWSFTRFPKAFAATSLPHWPFTTSFFSHSVLAILHTGAVWRDSQVIAGQSRSETGSSALAFMRCRFWVPSPASQFSCWWLQSFCFPDCTSLVLAGGYRPILVLCWAMQTYP